MSKTQDKIPDLWISVEGNLIKHKYISHTQISTKGSCRLDFENEEINKISHIIKRVYLQECKKWGSKKVWLPGSVLQIIF